MTYIGHEKRGYLFQQHLRQTMCRPNDFIGFSLSNALSLETDESEQSGHYFFY